MTTKSRSQLRAVVLLFLVLVCLQAVASAKDEWTQVRSKNFLLVGNASEKEIRKVGTRLEQFRETFRLVFSQISFSAAIPTNVIVFKSDSAYKPFKPKRADGKLDTFVAGYFQPGEDENYITLAVDGDESQMYGVIFHEYVHFIIDTNFGKSEIPPWFNEGMAEYYETFQIENDQVVKLGLQQERHIALLRQSKFIPLEQLFRVSNSQLPQSGDHSRTIFYAESWALMHYLIQGGKGKDLDKFLNLVLKDVPQEKAFQEAFQMTYADMENQLRKYIDKSTYQYSWVKLSKPLTFDAEMQTTKLDEATSNAYLGDLLYHVNRSDDAEPYLRTAISLQPDLSMANTALGMVKVRQRKYEDAKTLLEKAITADQKNHMAYYQYAYLLSREGRDDFGYVRGFPPETAARMRDALGKAIALKPEFTESYELLAFVNLVNNEQLDQSVALLKKALQYQPGNQRYAMRIAEILVRQEKYAEAGAIAAKLASTTDDPEVKSRAENLESEMKRMQQFREQQTAMRNRYGNGVGVADTGGPALRRPSTEKPMSEEEIAKLQEKAELISINQELRKPLESEKRLLGSIQKIECKPGVVYTIKTENETFSLVSKDFQGLEVNVFIPEANDVAIGCGSSFSNLLALITYKDRAIPKSTARGDLVSVEFVPKNFRIMTEDEMKPGSTNVLVEASDSSAMSEDRPVTVRGQRPQDQDVEAMRRDFMMKQIKESLRQPQAGEKREIGYLDKIECTAKGNFFYMRTAAQTLKLLSTGKDSPFLKSYTNDLEGVQFGCQLKALDSPAVFVYKDSPNSKLKSAGEIVSLEFVPKSFTLN